MKTSLLLLLALLLSAPAVADEAIARDDEAIARDDDDSGGDDDDSASLPEEVATFGWLCGMTGPTSLAAGPALLGLLLVGARRRTRSR